MAKRIATLALTITIMACGGSHSQSGQSGGRLSDADYRAAAPVTPQPATPQTYSGYPTDEGQVTNGSAMEHGARFVEPGSQHMGVSEEMARAIELDQRNEQQRLAEQGQTPSLP